MSKESLKIALTYIITLIVAFAVIGGAAYYIFTKYVRGDKSAGAVEQTVTESVSAENSYAPSEADSMTLLLIYSLEKRQTASCFMLVRILPAEKKLVVVPLQSDICAEVDGMKSTLYEFYRTGGSLQTVKAVENASGIKIDRYMKFDKSSFTVIIDLLGGVQYNVPYNLIYDNTDGGEDTIIKQGNQYLDSSLLSKVITFPNFKNGEEERAKVTGTLIADVLKSNITPGVRSSLDSMFSEVINSSVETNVTAYDYKDKKEALKYLIDPEQDNIVTLVLPSGTYDENKFYVLDEKFVKSLKVWFNAAEQ